MRKCVVLHTSCLYFKNWSIACKINIGISFVENPPGIYELPFLFSFHSWRNTCLRFLVFFLLFCTLHLSPAITFGPDFTFNDSINDFLPCAPSFHFIHKQKWQNCFCYINSFWAFWQNHVVNGLVLILNERTMTWSSPRNTNGKHFDRSYIFQLNILSLWYLHQVLSPFGQ